ncbi:MAG: transposase [Candidatus Thermoplasmatota archaeon]|nr:transposase [Candidatus Thermoplasmatota archaeon]
MHANAKHISKSTIEKEIYNTFERLKSEKHKYIASYLKHLNLEKLLPSNYQSINYPYHSLIRLLIFKQLKDIRFTTDLIRYLKRHSKERYQLGLPRTPNQRTLSHFTTNILDKDTKEIINYIATVIEEVSEKFSLLPDLKLPEPNKPPKPPKDRTIYNLKKQKTYQVTKIFKKRFTQVINLNLHHNTRYNKQDFIDLLLHMCKTRDFAENGSHALKVTKECVPKGETLLYHLKNYRNTDQIKQMFTLIFEMNWEIARKKKMFDRPVDVGIDFTDIPFYGDKNADMIVEKKPGAGTTHCYRYATINIVDRNIRFVLLAVPYGKFDNKERILHQLLGYARERIKIRRLYADRAFFTSNCIEIFKRYGIKFIIPAPVNRRIRELIDAWGAPSMTRDYPMKNSRFNVAVVKDEYGVDRAFATNIDFNEYDVGFSQHLFKLYGKRWGVETTYRVLKHTFWPKTTSKNYFIRLFYFLLSCLLYNLWILGDVIVCKAVFGQYQKDYIITSKLFIAILLNVDGGGG